MSHCKIVSHTCGGMGNRIKCLLGSLYHTETVRVCWPTHLDQHMMSNTRATIEPYSDILKNGIQEISVVAPVADELRAAGWTLRSTYKWFDDIDTDFEFAPQIHADRWSVMLNLARRYLIPSDKVSEIYNKRLSIVDKCTHGIFIRTGDTQRLTYPANYRAITDYHVNSGAWTFVVGDSPRVYEHFMNQPRVVCFLEDDYMYSGWPAHFANMLLLARCTHLTMPRMSTYSEVVYLLNGFKAQLQLLNLSGRGERVYDSMSIDQLRQFRHRLVNNSYKSNNT